MYTADSAKLMRTHWTIVLQTEALQRKKEVEKLQSLSLKPSTNYLSTSEKGEEPKGQMVSQTAPSVKNTLHLSLWMKE